MLTINRPFYEYRDIYLFIAVGLVAFIATFAVLSIASTISTNQLSQSLRSDSRGSSSTAVGSDKVNESDSTDKKNDSSGTAVKSSHTSSPALSGATTAGPSTSGHKATANPTVTEPANSTATTHIPATNTQASITAPAPQPSTPVIAQPTQNSDEAKLLDINLLGLRIAL